MFHAECVGDTTKTEDGRLFDTMQNQFAKNGDANKRLVMKMDVEGAEWDSLLHASDTTLDNIDQLAIELHYINDERFVRTVLRLKQFFHVAHLHFNNVSCADGLDPFPAWAYQGTVRQQANWRRRSRTEAYGCSYAGGAERSPASRLPAPVTVVRHRPRGSRLAFQNRQPSYK